MENNYFINEWIISFTITTIILFLLEINNYKINYKECLFYLLLLYFIIDQLFLWKNLE